MTVRWLEHTLTATGAMLLAIVALAYLDAAYGSASALQSFAAAAATADDPMAVPDPDQSDWSSARRRDYVRDTAKDQRLPIAVLRIESLDLEVPVFDDTGTRALNRGAGHLPATSFPGEAGNIAIAGHRDGFFRPLEKITPGTRIELQTLTGSQQFVVAETLIVDPLDISVLDPTDAATLTLITCYPFRYVGHAPDRFIVKALQL